LPTYRPTKPSHIPTKPLYKPAKPSHISTKPSYLPPGSTFQNGILPPGPTTPTYLPSYVPGITGRPSYVPPAISSYQPTTSAPSWPTKPSFAADELPNYQGSILQNSVSAEKLFGQFSTLKELFLSFLDNDLGY
jgi:hypothetical protein